MEHPIFFMDDLEKIRATPMTLGLPSDSKMGRPGISTTVAPVASRGLQESGSTRRRYGEFRSRSRAG